MTSLFIPRFTPSILPADALEALLVKHEPLVKRLVEGVRQSALTPAKQQTLLIGPRGAGKTHLTALLYHRVHADQSLTAHLRIAWLREEAWGLTSFLDLLLRILSTLAAEYESRDLTERMARLYDIPRREGEHAALNLLKDYVGHRTLLLLIENLDEVFAGLGERGQQALRAYLQQEARCTIVATVPGLFDAVQLRTSPFFGFFRVVHLAGLSFEEALALLAKIAMYQEKPELAAAIASPRGRARVRVVQHLAAGNPRLFVIFAGFLSVSTLDELVEPLLRTLDDLTPYYQARMAELPAQQRKIVAFLAETGAALSVKVIARSCMLSQQATSSQLGTLVSKGYVRHVSVPTGRESHYEVAEPLLRLCLAVKQQGGAPVGLLITFLRLWYTREELAGQLAELPITATSRAYVQAALDEAPVNLEEINLQVCGEAWAGAMNRHDWPCAIDVARELIALDPGADQYVGLGLPLLMSGDLSSARDAFIEAGSRGMAHAKAWHYLGLAHARLGEDKQAITAFDWASKLAPHDADNWLLLGVTLARLSCYNEAREPLGRATALAPKDADGWRVYGSVLAALDAYDDALVAFEQALVLAPEDAQTHALQGNVLYLLKRPLEALEQLDMALTLDPAEPRALNYRVVVLHSLGRYDAALTALAAEIQAGPNAALAYCNRAVLLSERGRYSEALEDCDQSIALGLESALIRFKRAECLLALERWDEGSTALGVALADTVQEAGMDDASDGNVTQRIVAHLFSRSLAGQLTPEQIDTLVALYAENRMLGLLGWALLQTIPLLANSRVGQPAVQEWLKTWSRVTAEEEELRLPLRHLSVAVAYRVSRDPRVLLTLPAEERSLLTALFNDQVDTGTLNSNHPIQ